MIPLPQSELHRVRHLFGSAHESVVIEAMIAGNRPGRVWADDPVAPAAALIWDGTYSVYLADGTDRLDVWRDLVEREVLPSCRGLLKAHLSDHAAATVLAGLPMQRRDRVFYRGGRLAIPDWRSRLPDEFRISDIDAEFDGLRRLAHVEDMIGEIESEWRSVSAFRHAGLGFAAHDGTAIVCWCTAEYVSDGRCGIGIETIGSHRGRGLATLTASAFVERCVERDMMPHWDAWASNHPSVAVAERVGFDRVETYSIFVGSLTR